ncbi:MAG: NADH-quinone oxidoreductase subunit L [Alphaproteobacteria bacterium]|jgi:NADH-quinone oxidoreductase subunit L|nr:NADH-quinone oxidoreductase subunit L [Alphaproteobacteria bacterium]
MIWYIVSLPFLGFLVAGIISIFNAKTENSNSLNFLAWLLSTAATGLSAAISLWFLISMIKMSETTIVIEAQNWFISGNLIVNFGFTFDKLVAIMVFVVGFISFMVHFYSYFYINKEDNLARFQSYLSLFTFSMIFLVVSNNLIEMFIGWELISFCSYLLIAFWYKEEAPKKASAKAFLVNRFADVGFLLGTFSLFALIGSMNFADINATAISNVAWMHFNIFGIDINYIDFIAVCFLLAAFAKSSQIILHIWLPDAMEAPTPVSALLHAATMVTAGVFLIIKLAPIYEASTMARNIILVFAGITALYGALVACMQKDIKRIIAYSTMSQLGYMFLAIGVGAFSAAFFHLFTHAFFKALLFLGAGSVIHGMGGEQNINKMGNLWRKMPITYICMIIGFLALIGVPGFAGFYSKEAILNFLYMDEQSGYVMFAYYSAIIAVFFTSFYSLRLIINVFHGKENYNKEHIHVHESPVGILFVLITLAVLSILTGTFLYDSFVGETSAFIFNGLFTVKTMPEEALEHSIKYITMGLAFIAFLLVYVIYIREKGLSGKMKKTFPSVYNLVLNKFYFDEIYEYCIVNPSLKLSRKLGKFDDNSYDKYGVNALAGFMYRVSRTFSFLQTGFINFYAVIMVLGVFLILTYCFFILGIK